MLHRRGQAGLSSLNNTFPCNSIFYTATELLQWFKKQAFQQKGNEMGMVVLALVISEFATHYAQKTTASL